MRQWQPRLGVWRGERVEGLAELEQQLAIAIFTPLGSAEGNPEFGSLVHNAIDESIVAARLLVAREVRRVVQRWVPRVVIISVGAEQLATGQLVLDLKWRPRDSDVASQQLTRVIESERPADVTPGIAPTFSVSPSITGSVLLGSTLTCDPGEYSGTDPLFVTYQWRRDGVAIVGATATTYLVILADLTGLPDIDCLVTVQNAIAVVSEAAPPVVHVPVVPSFTVDPSITGSFLLGETLTCVPGTWTGTEPLIVEYQWRRSDTPISGATSATYEVVSLDVSSPLTCEVTVSNMAGSDAAVSPERFSDATPPAFVSGPVISGTVALGSELTCAPGTWTGTAPITVTYQWRRNGVAVGGATAATYTLVSADCDAAVGCTVSLVSAHGSVDATATIAGPTFESLLLGAKVWIHARSPSYLTLSPGNLVDAALDVTGHGNHPSASGSQRPIYDAAAFGGRGALVFSGAQKLLSPAFACGAGTSGTVFWFPSATSQAALEFGPLNSHLLVFAEVGHINVRAPGAGDAWVAHDFTTPVRVTWRTSPGGITRALINGVVYANSGVASPTPRTAQLSVGSLDGGVYWLNGLIGEVVFADAMWSDAEMDLVDAVMAARWT